MDIIFSFFSKYSIVIISIIGSLFAITLASCLVIPSLVRRAYQKIAHFLTNHKRLAIFLSHGGVHITLLSLFSIIALWMVADVAKNNIATFNQVIYTFYGDTLKNYKLSTIKLRSDLRRRPGNVYYPNDMRIEYSFTRDLKVDSPRIVNLFNNPKIRGYYDLISKIHVIVNNESPIINYNPLNTVYHPTTNKQVCNSIKYTSHNKYYYGRSSIEDSTHNYIYSFYGKDVLKEWSKLNPYFKFWIGINMECNYEVDDKSEIAILLNDARTGDFINEPINIEEIIPNPSERTVSQIMYKGKDKINEVIKNGGIYVSAFDPEKKAETDKRQLLYSVFAGTLIAFCIDIFVQLILKWRKINDTNDN